MVCKVSIMFAMLVACDSWGGFVDGGGAGTALCAPVPPRPSSAIAFAACR